ncbi:MAG: stage III sporulation protein AA [Eubacteriales bacterium]|nr:stage III sporulation protein AA [Eubacteriales bacterium]
MQAEQITCLFAKNIRRLLEEDKPDYDKLYEIRMRVGRPLFLIYEGGERFLRQNGRCANGTPYLVTRQDLQETLEYVSGYSMYAYEEELRQGFLSIQGGHRVGVTGKVILEGNRIQGMKYISCINIRLSHQVKGCATKILPMIHKRGHVYHTLIVSPPRCGKTTLLRDIIRQISNGWGDIPGCNVGVVDERSELAGCYRGIPQNDLGMRTDILDGCPKAEGMMMLIRSMSPKVVAVDELGKEEDFQAVEAVVNCGCRLIATVHGGSLEDLCSKPLFEKLMRQQVFERYIFLSSREQAGTIRVVLDKEGRSCM